MTNEPNNHEWRGLLTQAASQSDADPETFLRAAWGAYFDAHPGMREHLEQLHLLAELDQLRKDGRIGLA